EVLGESLRVARDLSERQSLEKDLLVREVHSFDYFMGQLQDEFRKIRGLEQQAGRLDPQQDPLSAMDSERARILGAARAARGRILQPAEIRDTTHFVAGHMRTRVIRLDEGREYQLLSQQSPSALETHLTPEGTFRGSLHIRDPEAFWRGSKWLVIVAK